MKPIKFSENCKMYGETQEAYYTLPVLEVDDQEYGSLKVSAWKPTIRERFSILFGRPLFLAIVGGQPPVDLTLKPEKFIPEEIVGELSYS